MRSFLDTNVLVYLFDADAPEKQSRAQRLFESESAQGRCVLSTQVLQEFYVAATRKLRRPLDPRDAEQAVHDLSRLPVVQVDPGMIRAAISRSLTAGFSFRNSLIVEAAVASGADRLYTEDLQHGQRIGTLEVVDPFH
ncbi:MAG TPA: PIN domain-containing protein [Longimicrobiaceae bacterium]|nr:PIN domain-containing protein [Longimicrobiaceae bacterium]